MPLPRLLRPAKAKPDVASLQELKAENQLRLLSGISLQHSAKALATAAARAHASKLPAQAFARPCHAFGTQGYTCLPTSTGGTAWNPTARPEATLFANLFGHLVQIITHFASIDANPNDTAPKPVSLGGNATWQSSFDTSKVWAVADGHIDAGTDASCPNAGSIQCLRLRSIGNQEGPTGGKLLATTTFVQRLNTNGGAVPTTSCSVGQTQLVPYTADYYFFRGDE